LLNQQNKNKNKKGDSLGVPLTTFGSAHSPLHPQLMLWFTYYKGTFSTFVFATQNRAFMLRSVLRTLRPYMRLTQKLTSRGKKIKNMQRRWKMRPLQGRIEEIPSFSINI
jgi:hypothetical protein